MGGFMKRFYYVSDSLDELAQVAAELDQAGIGKPQVHIVSRDEAGVDHRDLHRVQDFMRRDVVRAGLLGAIAGVVCAAVILVAAYLSDLPMTVGWAPFLLFAAIALGFCTWEGGLFGLHKPHHELRRMEPRVRAGQHVLFVDTEPQEVAILREVQARHERLRPVGEGSATPAWVIRAQQKWQKFFHAMP
jgi:hypothetical protein